MFQPHGEFSQSRSSTDSAAAVHFRIRCSLAAQKQELKAQSPGLLQLLTSEAGCKTRNGGESCEQLHSSRASKMEQLQSAANHDMAAHVDAPVTAHSHCYWESGTLQYCNVARQKTMRLLQPELNKQPWRHWRGPRLRPLRAPHLNLRNSISLKQHLN